MFILTGLRSIGMSISRQVNWSGWDTSASTLCPHCMAMDVSRYCTQYFGMKPLQSEVERSTVKGAFSRGVLPHQRTDLGCWSFVMSCFHFAALVQFSPLRLRQLKARACTRSRMLRSCWSACSRLAEGCTVDGHPSWVQFPGTVMFAPVARSQNFHWHQKTCPWIKITLFLHTSYCSSLPLKSSPI